MKQVSLAWRTKYSMCLLLIICFSTTVYAQNVDFNMYKNLIVDDYKFTTSTRNRLDPYISEYMGLMDTAGQFKDFLGTEYVTRTVSGAQVVVELKPDKINYYVGPSAYNRRSQNQMIQVLYMDTRYYSDFRTSISAKKSLFFFDDYVVCLGAGINRQVAGTGRLTTSVNQVFLDNSFELLIDYGQGEVTNGAESYIVAPVIVNSVGMLIPCQLIF